MTYLLTIGTEKFEAKLLESFDNKCVVTIEGFDYENLDAEQALDFHTQGITVEYPNKLKKMMSGRKFNGVPNLYVLS